MIGKYGNYTHDQNELGIDGMTSDAVVGDGGIITSVIKRAELYGRLQADTPALLTPKILALEAAYSIQGADFVLYLDDGSTETAHKLKSSETAGGVRVMSLSWEQGPGEYTTYRNYKITLEAEFLLPGITIVSWSETLQRTGTCGPRTAHKHPLVGPPIKQLLLQQTTMRVTQSGQAVGLTGYPFVPAPIWPDAELEPERQISPGIPERVGPPGSPTYLRYPISWSYTFESASPLIGFPTPWPV